MRVDAGWFRRQYCQGRSIFSGSARTRGPAGAEGAKVVPVRNAADRRGGERQNMLPARQEVVVALGVDARFLSHSDRVARSPSYGTQITHALLPIRAKRRRAIFATEVPSRRNLLARIASGVTNKSNVFLTRRYARVTNEMMFIKKNNTHNVVADYGADVVVH